MQLGYIIASHEVMRNGQPIGYLYRQAPDNDRDSGWRVFSGTESQQYADNPLNFALYNASTVAELHPQIVHLLVRTFPVAFARDETTGEFLEVPFPTEPV
jgi:hypothetical protein